MKSLMMIIALTFSSLQSYAIFSGDASTPTPLLRCYNQKFIVTVNRLSNEKDHQLVVKERIYQNDEKVLMKTIVWPVSASEEQLKFMNPNSSLTVVHDDRSSFGFFTLNRRQPGISHHMVCETIFNVLPYADQY